jgi:hypothetical protein
MKKPSPFHTKHHLDDTEMYIKSKYFLFPALKIIKKAKSFQKHEF